MLSIPVLGVNSNPNSFIKSAYESSKWALLNLNKHGKMGTSKEKNKKKLSEVAFVFVTLC